MTLLSRSQVSDFVRLEGLQKLTGVTAHDWDLYIFKELVDNALDADEAYLKGVAPDITVEMQYDGEGLAVVVGNKAPFPIDYVEEIFDLTKRASVKDFYNYPSRGAQGNALKTILGIPYALQNFYFSDYKSNLMLPLSIRSGFSQVDMRLEVDEVRQTVALHPERKTLKREIPRTEISVNIFRFRQKRPRMHEELLNMSRVFALFNPHCNFKFAFAFRTADGEIREYDYKSEADATWSTKYDLSQFPPVTWYTLSQFRALLHALILHNRTHTGDALTLDSVAQHVGLQQVPVNPAIEGSALLETFLEGNSLKTSFLEAFFELLKQETESTIAPPLGAIGEKQLFRFWKATDGANPDEFLSVYRQYNSLEEPRESEPFVLEVFLHTNGSAQRQIHTGINNTTTYRDPFFNKPLVPPNADEPQRSLEKLLDYYEIRDTTPITMTIHLIAPGIIYEDYGKSAITDEPYRSALIRLIDDIIKEYKAAIRPIDYLTEPAKQLLPTAIQALSGKPFSQNQLMYDLKRQLRNLNDANILADLASSDADTRLLQVIQTYHTTSPIAGLYHQHSGRLAVAKHPDNVISVPFATGNILEFLRTFHARAVVITNRTELEDVFIALKFPLRYDLAVLRSDASLTAVEFLVKQIWLGVQEESLHDLKTLPTLWLLRDASLEGVQLAHTVRHLVERRGLPRELVVDFGLHVDNFALQQAWRERRRDDSKVDPSQLPLTQGEIRFYLEEKMTVPLDSLPPQTLMNWFDQELEHMGIALKWIPDIGVLTEVAGHLIRSQLRALISRIASDDYGLDTVLQVVAEGWQRENKDWEQKLAEELKLKLAHDPFYSWENKLEGALSEILSRFLTYERLQTIRVSINSAVKNTEHLKRL